MNCSLVQMTFLPRGVKIDWNGNGPSDMDQFFEALRSDGIRKDWGGGRWCTRWRGILMSFICGKAGCGRMTQKHKGEKICACCGVIEVVVDCQFILEAIDFTYSSKWNIELLHKMLEARCSESPYLNLCNVRQETEGRCFSQTVVINLSIVVTGGFMGLHCEVAVRSFAWPGWTKSDNDVFVFYAFCIVLCFPPT